jgi:uncharacterized protein (DUF2126 family)
MMKLLLALGNASKLTIAAAAVVVAAAAAGTLSKLSPRRSLSRRPALNAARGKLPAMHPNQRSQLQTTASPLPGADSSQATTSINRTITHQRSYMLAVGRNVKIHSLASEKAKQHNGKQL